MLIGTVDLYHSYHTPFVTLTSAGGHKVSEKQNPMAPFLAHFAKDQNEI